MKILFVSFLNGRLQTGGEVCSKRNYESLISLYGSENVILFSITRNQQGRERNKLIWFFYHIFVDIFNMGVGGLDKKQKKEIINQITKLNINVVFLDSSLFGSIAREIKKNFSKVRIYSFFHNVEYLFFKQLVKERKKILLWYRVVIAYISEYLICKHSDRIGSLNQRDGKLITSIYKRTPDVFIPVSLKDSYVSTLKRNLDKSKIGLFVGSYFFPNVHGIKWFVKSVMPCVNIKLLIVGSGMDKLAAELNGEQKIEIFSNVPDLTYYYESADFVVMPIFLGGGMKVKTAEALMYGKYIFGTTEAFVGYEIDDKVGRICDSKEEFIISINQKPCYQNYNLPSKKLFIEKYSYQATLNKFKELISWN